ncbi:response regulator transcription factor [Clostridium cellulovorans]|uniref:Stage 0 sporulation protein A homolog n=1 Tax=Clostridium cellulovorans (strain ATCC 35296 / DSM 3052 / OCM 3 / 743B) TaxID=573061 RepID=D9SMP1_CLOC7|nr:response regulator transcription factor [Clostridium cellulovorans]ADL49826.1 two component transcriptional regulator, AraC family [Clostridium cellulovorans 743B]
MLNVLIVDDEPIVREGLKIIIDWNKYGYTVCGEGLDGKDGFEKILTLKPDLVLVDINMPGMNGIEMIKAAKEQGALSKFIVLTGYSQFEYAQNAIKLGVKSYLLKPIDEDELIENLKGLYLEIEQEKNKNKYLNLTKKHLRNELLRKIVTGSYLQDDLIEYREISGQKSDAERFVVSIIDTCVGDETTKPIKIEERIEECLKDKMDIGLCRVEGKYVITFVDKSDASIKMLLSSIYNQLVGNKNVSAFIAIGESVEVVEDISKSYKSAKEIIENKFIYDDEKIVKYGSTNQGDKDITFGKDDIQALYTSIEIGDMDKLTNTIKLLEKSLINSNLSTEKMKGLLIKYFLEIKSQLVASFPEYKDKFPKDDDIINGIYSYANLKTLLQYIKEEFMSMSEVIENNCSDNIMKRIVNYIDRNYYKDIKLEMLAEIFNYNSAYLGKMFKNHTNESFNSYLDKIRIENAKKLLTNDSLKVYQVSEKVGYKNIDYFYSKFKRYVGMSPKEYKKLNKCENL